MLGTFYIKVNRLENLYKYESVNKTATTNYSSLVFSKRGNVGHVFLDIPSSVANGLREGALLFIFPEGYKPKSFNLKIMSSHPTGKTARTRYEESTGKVYLLSSTGVNESLYLDTFYFLD